MLDSPRAQLARLLRAPLARFLAVGVLNTAVAFVVFRGAYAALAGAPLAAARAQTVGTAVAMCVSYVCNRRWTFRSWRRPGPEFVRFVAAQGTMLVVSATLMQVGVSRLGLPVTPWWVAVTGGTAVLNFLVMRGLVFRTGGARPQLA